MGQIRYSPGAREDLHGIWSQVARDNGPVAAGRKWDRIEQRAALLADHPEMGPARPEIGDDARHLVFERWLILYRKTAGGIEVIRIVDGVRDLIKLPWDPGKD